MNEITPYFLFYFPYAAPDIIKQGTYAYNKLKPRKTNFPGFVSNIRALINAC